MKFSPGVVPQCPSSRGLTCSSAQRLAQQRVVLQVDLPDRQVVRRAPVRVHAGQLGRIEGGVGDGRDARDSHDQPSLGRSARERAKVGEVARTAQGGAALGCDNRGDRAIRRKLPGPGRRQRLPARAAPAARGGDRRRPVGRAAAPEPRAAARGGRAQAGGGGQLPQPARRGGPGGGRVHRHALRRLRRPQVARGAGLGARARAVRASWRRSATPPPRSSPPPRSRRGYLNSYFQVDRTGAERFVNLAWDHELYCAGHLIQAAVAHARGTGDTRLLDVAPPPRRPHRRAVRPGRNEGTPGHPEIETALVELHRLTGEPRYLELAGFLVDTRGHGTLQPARFGSAYFQDHAPVREATEVTGHCVRQLYLDAGVDRPPPRDRRGRAARRPAGAVAGHDRAQDVPHRRARSAPHGRGVRRPLRAAARPLLRRDVRGDRLAALELADAAADRRGALRRPLRARALQRLQRRPLARRPRLLLRQPAARPRPAPRHRARSRGSRARAARRT